MLVLLVRVRSRHCTAAVGKKKVVVGSCYSLPLAVVLLLVWEQSR